MIQSYYSFDTGARVAQRVKSVFDWLILRRLDAIQLPIAPIQVLRRLLIVLCVLYLIYMCILDYF